jgi:hypothetical protein
MSNLAFNRRMPAGIPGNINRLTAGFTSEPNLIMPVGEVGAPSAYGLGVALDVATGAIRVPTTGDTALYGILPRPFPANASTDGIGAATPPADGEVDVLKRGYISVLLQNATACIKGGAVYCRIDDGTADLAVGGFEAADDGAHTILVDGAYFTGPADADGNTEVAFNV